MSLNKLVFRRMFELSKKNNHEISPIIRTLSIILLLICCFYGRADSQNPDFVIWPGDINNNGLVNHVDVLYMGAAFGETGDVRDDQTIQFDSLDTPVNWVYTFPNGLSGAFADCNGDGVVAQNDLQAIQVNYDLEHDQLFADSFVLDENAINAELFFDTLGQQLQGMPGESYSIPISLGAANNQISNFYGIAFTLEVNTNYVDLSTLDFDNYEQTWTNPSTNGLLKLQKRSFTENVFEVAISRRDMLTASGFGAIGELKFIIEENLPDYAPDIEIIKITEIFLVDEDLKQHFIIDDSGLTMDFLSSTSNLPKNDFSIYPNPVANGLLNIDGLEHYPEAIITMIDVAGREQVIMMESNTINTGNLPSGIYFLNIYTPKGQHTEKIIIQH